MAATVHSMQAEGRCELCGARDEGSFRSRMAHLKAEHPAYARGLILRLVAPLVFLVVVLALAALKAPSWAYLIGFGASFALLFFGKVRSRVERSRAGARPTIGIKRLVREGGLGFVLIIPAVALLILLLSRN
jgi:hypothetical protein